MGALPPVRLPVTTAEGLGRAHAGLILQTVLAEGSIARAELSDRVGLTRATVTRVVTKLIDLGLLREGSPRRESAGRPMVPLTLAGENRAVLSLHFGAREFRVGLVDLRGRVLDEVRDAYSSTEPADVVASVAQRATALLSSTGGSLRMVGAGVSIGGWVSSERGEVVRFDPLGWRDVPLGVLLAQSFDLPVHLDQVVRGLALAERMFGAAKGVDHFIELWVGNVVGVALVEGGVVRSGTAGAFGMIAHLPTRDTEGFPCECGRAGCLEKNINDLAMVEAARRQGLLPQAADIRALVRLSDHGDVAASNFLTEKGAVAGEAAATIADLTDPSMCVVAGVSTTADAFLSAFRSAFHAHALRSNDIEVRASAFGDLAPTIASASVLLDDYYRDPLGYERAANAL